MKDHFITMTKSQRKKEFGSLRPDKGLIPLYIDASKVLSGCQSCRAIFVGPLHHNNGKSLYVEVQYLWSPRYKAYLLENSNTFIS
jgi:hypothetical protein